jgi:hypothetical protein
MMRYSGKHVSKKIFAKYYLVLTFPNSWLKVKDGC